MDGHSLCAKQISSITGRQAASGERQIESGRGREKGQNKGAEEEDECGEEQTYTKGKSGGGRDVRAARDE